MGKEYEEEEREEEGGGGEGRGRRREEERVWSAGPPRSSLALAVLTDAPGSIWAGVVASAAHDHLALAGVRAHCVDAVEARAAGLRQTGALIDVCRMRGGGGGEGGKKRETQRTRVLERER